MNMKKYLLVSGLLLIPLQGFAATDGTLGQTSTGTLNINLTLNNTIQISQLEDIAIDYTLGVDTGDVDEFSPACVFINSASPNYKVKINGQNDAGGKLYLSDGQAVPNTIEYVAKWHTDSSATSASPSTLVPNTDANIANTIKPTSSSCDAGVNNNASIQFTIEEGDLTTATAGVYTDVVTILVTPL